MINAIDVTNLNYSYPDGTKALDGIDIKIEEGEKTVIVGPNGAGKTTLFLHLNGTLKSQGKNVSIFGRNISEMAIEERIREIGIIFQDPDDQLFMPTVYDDIAFGPLNMGLENKEVDEKVKKALSIVGLEGFEDKVPHHLSYGQKKKVAMASVLSMEPKILVIDEPTANLDPRSRKELIKLINKLNKNQGITIIMATHDVNALPQLSDRVYVLNHKIIAQGSPREIFSDSTVLKENNLEAPDVFKLFKVLGFFGYDYDTLPLSIDEAIEELTKTIETNNGHIHLHIHEHTHQNIRDFINNNDHHH
ncbi:energy-coupling factor ABC transporter ATP-binding protein [Methanohalobium sp.]|uniref:energy-coupling factor ABC transporter ATP-binding protein n=1 Tax=Methanohalobium sp. TaxID=2837493 RepID=UPI0025CE78C4|nr:ATP-binding cassette domain-containing protein [Methanohalobium sp.]